MIATILIVGVVGVSAFVAGIIVGRANAKRVNQVVSDVKTVEAAAKTVGTTITTAASDVAKK